MRFYFMIRKEPLHFPIPLLMSVSTNKDNIQRVLTKMKNNRENTTPVKNFLDDYSHKQLEMLYCSYKFSAKELKLINDITQNAV